MYQEKDEMATISWGRLQLVTQDAVSPSVMVVGGRLSEHPLRDVGISPFPTFIPTEAGNTNGQSKMGAHGVRCGDSWVGVMKA